jgi:hypothetical protein
VNTRHDIALTYNDKSVLEQFHLASGLRPRIAAAAVADISSVAAFRLIWREKNGSVSTNIVKNLLPDEQKRFRSHMIEVPQQNRREPLEWRLTPPRADDLSDGPCERVRVRVQVQVAGFVG